MKFKTILLKSKDIHDIKVKNGFIVIGDIHLFNSYPYSLHSDLISSRLKDLSNVLKEVSKVRRRLKLPLVLNGDTIHSGILDYPVELILTEFLLRNSKGTVLINLGNHDLDGEVSVLDPLIKFSENNSHIVFTKSQIYNINKVNYCFMPFMTEAQAIIKLKRLAKKVEDHETNILFIHNSFSGSSFPSNVKSKSGLSQRLKELKKFDLIVASHIHKYQKICNGRGFYTSSPIPLNFGEKDKEHGYHIVDLEKHVRYFVIPKAPKFRYINVSKMLEMNVDKIKKKVSGNIICVKIDRPEYMSEKSSINKKLTKYGALFVTFKNELVKSVEKKADIKLVNDLTSVVSSYSKIIAKKFHLKRKEVEKQGLRILNKAKKQISKEKQRR